MRCVTLTAHDILTAWPDHMFIFPEKVPQRGAWHFGLRENEEIVSYLCNGIDVAYFLRATCKCGETHDFGLGILLKPKR